MSFTTEPEKNEAKTQIFLQMLCDRLVRQKKYSENIVKAVTERLQLRVENQIVLASIQDPIYENFIKQQDVQQEFFALTTEVWGTGTQFVMKSKTLPAKKRPAKVTQKLPIVESIFSHEAFLEEITSKKDPKLKNKLLTQAPPAATETTRTQNSPRQPDENSPIQVSTTRKKSSALSELTNINRMFIAESAQTLANSMEEYGSRPPENSLCQLDPDLTFDTFVQVRNNELASQACLNAAKSPGKAANPVFIYGSTGLGKTHLLHAVGNEIRKNHPNWIIRYVTSEEFMLELMSAIRHHRQDEFRNKFRMVDVLLVDDIQFLEKKDSTQIEFFHTFNELYNNRKQIVITSDQYPKSIPNIEERLKSRFLQGLIASIDMPEFEDRVAIIEVKAKAFGLKLSREQIELIATHIKSNVREITGALTTLLVNHSMNGETPNLSSISHLLRKEVSRKSGEITPSAIKKLVAQQFQIRVQDLMSSSRKEDVVLPRHIAMYLTREILGLTTTDVALEFGRRDHTTVLNATKRVAELIENDASTLATIKELKRKIELNQDL